MNIFITPPFINLNVVAARGLVVNANVSENFILLETGDFILLETGDKIETEN